MNKGYGNHVLQSALPLNVSKAKTIGVTIHVNMISCISSPGTGSFAQLQAVEMKSIPLCLPSEQLILCFTNLPQALSSKIKLLLQF